MSSLRGTLFAIRVSGERHLSNTLHPNASLQNYAGTLQTLNITIASFGHPREVAA